MSETLQQPPDLLADLAYLPRVTRRDGRTIAEALHGPTLFDRGVRLRGAVVEASYAADAAPLLKRLREEAVPHLIDPQTLRFVGQRYRDVERLRSLPYAPPHVIDSATLAPAACAALAVDVLQFQQDHGASVYLAAGLPYQDRELQRWIAHNDRLLDASCAANGTGELDRRPLIAMVAPGRKALQRPELIVNRLLDYPIDAVYVQATNLHPVRDSVEKLITYTSFLQAISASGLPVIASRVGAFGLVLQAVGVRAFDSGLGQAETCDLASLNRPQTQRERDADSRGGGDRRIYFEQLRTTLPGRHAAHLIDESVGLRAHLTCSHGCCRHRGIDELPDRARQHYLWVRDNEVQQLRERPHGGMRVDLIHEQLRDARETARVVRRALLSRGLPYPAFDHLDRWIAVLGQSAQARAAA